MLILTFSIVLYTVSFFPIKKKAELRTEKKPSNISKAHYDTLHAPTLNTPTSVTIFQILR